MPAVEVKIWLALKSKVDTLALSFAKAWPGETFTPPYSGDQLQPYLRIGDVSVSPVPVLIEEGKRHDRTGTLIVTLVHPVGLDVAAYTQYAGQIAAHFAEGSRMYYDGVCVKVTAQPHVQPGYESNGYWNVPVTIPWRTFA